MKSTPSVNLLAKQYNVLELYPKILELVRKFFPDKDFTSYTKHQLHQFISDTIMESYCGESVLKYSLSKLFLDQPETIGAFEIKANDSRLDFLTIDQFSTSYEIKSEIDSLMKMTKQMADYASVFEYNYLAVADCHLSRVKKELMPGIGLMSYSKTKGFTKVKEALLGEPSSLAQLINLTKAERRKYFKEPSADIDKILKLAPPKLINAQFKAALMKRYKHQWLFVKQHQKDILPIDMQFYFKMNIDTKHIHNY
jgi:hypothetical protein